MTVERTGQAGSDPAMEWKSFDGDGSPGPAASEGGDHGDGAANGGTSVRPAKFVSLTDEPGSSFQQTIDLLRDVEVELTVELGSARMQIKHILGLRPGSVVELNRLAGEPVDIMINKTLIARGEVVVVDEKFAIRVVEIVPPERRLANS